MKLSLIASLICLGMIGCAHSLPPENYGITETRMVCEQETCKKVTHSYPVHEVTVRPLTQPKVVEEVTEVKEPIHTWMVESDTDQMAMRALQKAMHDAVEANDCMCRQGDPLCSCITTDAPEITNLPKK